jgi:NhaP-type Na+/H+ or K+/H+ antiporter
MIGEFALAVLVGVLIGYALRSMLQWWKTKGGGW